MVTKTYGVADKLEWQTDIKVGRATFTLHFEGGSMTALGNLPAEYTTSNPVFQAVVENSEQFRRGLITLLRQCGREEAPAKEECATKKEDGAAGTGSPESPGDSEVCGGAECGAAVEFACLDDAKAWLHDEHGADPARIKSVRQAVAAAKALGLVITVKP